MKKAFTLIELLVVVLIIGILAAIALPQYRLAVEKSRAAEAIVGVQTWYHAMQRYHLANGSYPANLTSAIEDMDVQLPTPKNFTFRYYNSAPNNTVYVGYVNNDYWITRVVSGGLTGWATRGITCNVSIPNNTSNFGAKVCKSLCGTELSRIWASYEYGCIIKS